MPVFGGEWGTKDLKTDTNSQYNFNLDTIIFFRVPFNYQEAYTFLKLDTVDSSFNIWHCSPFVFEGDTMVYCGYMESSDCTLSYEIAKDLVTFKMCDGKQFTFKVIHVGTKETNPILYGSKTRDYRTHIMLVRM